MKSYVCTTFFLQILRVPLTVPKNFIPVGEQLQFFANKITVLFNAFFISLLASLARLLFNPNVSFRVSLLTFFGGIVFGTVMGYTIDGISLLEPYSKPLVALCAIAGREICTTLIATTPGVMTWIGSKLSKVIKIFGEKE